MSLEKEKYAMPLIKINAFLADTHESVGLLTVVFKLSFSRFLLTMDTQATLFSWITHLHPINTNRIYMHVHWGRISPLNTFLMEQFCFFPFLFTHPCLNFLLLFPASKSCSPDFFFSSYTLFFIEHRFKVEFDFPSFIDRSWEKQHE